MIDDSGGITLNIAKLPVGKKKAKRNIEEFSEPKLVISSLPKPKKSEIKRKPLETKPGGKSVEPSGILKKSIDVPSQSIWKKFKQYNKGSNVTPGLKPNELMKKKVKEKIEPKFVQKVVSFNENTTKELPPVPKKTPVKEDDNKSSDNKLLFVNSPETLHKSDNEMSSKRKSKVIFSDDDNKPKVKKFVGSNETETEKKSGKTTSLFFNNPEIPRVPHRAVRPLKETVFSNLSFEDLDLHPFMVKYMKESMGLTKMTTVQEKSIPVLLEKKDALIKSQTGSGKTLAYALPILHELQGIRPKINRSDGVMVLIIVPTRELALQTFEVFNKLVKSYTWIVPGYLVGGEKRKSEKARLRKGISILIGTPGRLIDHVQHTKALKLNKVSCLVIDEADRLLDMGYERDVSILLETLNRNTTRLQEQDSFSVEKEEVEEQKKMVNSRQTVLLSATLSQKVERLAGLSLRNPVFVDACDENPKCSDYIPVFSSDVGQETDTMVLPESLIQKYIVTPPKLKLVTFTSFILWKTKLTKEKKMLVFMATQHMVDYYTELLSSVLSNLEEEVEEKDSDDENSSRFPNSGIELFKLHGNMKQNERTQVFKTFRESHLGVLLCTDVAARGLDLPEVDWVIQFTGPTSVSDYVHRVGRTARGGQSGSSIIFLTPNEVSFIGKLENCQIRLQEEKMEGCLENLLTLGGPGSSVQQEATALQLKFENFVANQSQLYDLAAKAYASWSRFYASYPRNMKDAFNVKTVHQGHYAKSFALRDTPSVIINYAKKKNLNEERVVRKRPRDRKESEKPKGLPGKSKFSDVSEFDSGLEPATKKKKK